MSPDDLVPTIAVHARPLGVHAVAVYLAELQQGWLRALPGGQTGSEPQLSIDATWPGARSGC